MIMCYYIYRALRYANVKMKKRFEPDYGSGATGFPEEGTDIGTSMRRLTQEEQDLLMTIFQFKREIRVRTKVYHKCLLNSATSIYM